MSGKWLILSVQRKCGARFGLCMHFGMCVSERVNECLSSHSEELWLSHCRALRDIWNGYQIGFDHPWATEEGLKCNAEEHNQNYFLAEACKYSKLFLYLHSTLTRLSEPEKNEYNKYLLLHILAIISPGLATVFISVTIVLSSFAIVCISSL